MRKEDRRQKAAEMRGEKKATEKKGETRRPALITQQEAQQVETTSNVVLITS